MRFFPAIIIAVAMLSAQPGDPWKGMYIERVTGIRLQVNAPVNGVYSGTFHYQGSKMPISATMQRGTITGNYEYQGAQFPFSIAQKQGRYYLTADGVTAEIERSASSELPPPPKAGTLSMQWTRKLGGRQLLFLETSGGGTSKMTLDLLADGQFRFASSSSYASGGYGDFSYAGQDKDFGTWQIVEEQGGPVLLTRSKKNGQASRTPIRQGATEGQVLLNGKRFFIRALE